MKQLAYKLILIGILFLLIISCENRGEIYGYIGDNDLNPLSEVLVKLYTDNEELKGNTTTESNGYFEFNNLGEGVYLVVASKQGYITQTNKLELYRDGFNCFGDFRGSERSGFTLKTNN